MTFERGKTYRDAIGRGWTILQIRDIKDDIVASITHTDPQNQIMYELAVVDKLWENTATILLDEGFTTLYADDEVEE